MVSFSSVDLLYDDVLSIVFQNLSLQDRIIAACARKSWLRVAENTTNCNDSITFEANGIQKMHQATQSPFFKQVTNVEFLFEGDMQDAFTQNIWLPAIAESMESTTHIQHLNLNFLDVYSMNEEGERDQEGLALALTQGFRNNHSIKSIRSNGNHLSEKNVEAVALLIKQNLLLESLEISICRINPKGIKDIAKSINMCHSLTRLKMESNKMDNQGVIFLCQEIVNHPTLTSLQLGHNEIGTDGIKFLADTLFRHNKVLTTIDLSDNLICEDNIGILTEPLRYIESLNVSFNRIGPRGITIMSDILKNKPSKTVTSLYLSGTDMGPEGTKSIVDFALHTKSIKSLHVGGNQIGSTGVIEIAKLIQTNQQNFKELDIHSNELLPQDVIVLSSALNNNKHLSTFNISSTDIKEYHCIEALSKAFKSNPSLTTLNLSFNKIGSTGVQILIDHIRQHPSIARLDLSWCDIGESSAKILIDYIKDTSTLTDLYLTCNPIESNYINSLVDPLECNKSISKLTIRLCEIDERRQALL